MKTVLWKKWQDPIQRLVDEFDDDDDEDDDDDFDGPVGISEPRNVSGRIGPCMVSSMGIIPLHEHNSPSKVFNLWVMHTGFPLTNKMKAAIKQVNGVESIDVYTSYRLRIGFGLNFNDSEVRRQIDYVLGANQPRSKSTLDVIKNLASNIFPFWAVEIDVEGKTSIFSGNSIVDVKNQLGTSQQTSRTLHSW